MMGHKEHAKSGHFLSVFGGAQEWMTYTLPGDGALYFYNEHDFFFHLCGAQCSGIFLLIFYNGDTFLNSSGHVFYINGRLEWF